MSTLPVLYSFRRCPYAMRARLALKASGLPVALREVVLRDKPAELLTASPKGTVPVLVLPTGEVIEQSLDIMRWALGQHDPQGWLPLEGSREAELTQHWLAANDGGFKALLDRYKYPERHPEHPASDWREQALAQHLQPLEALHQAQGGPHLLGPRPGLLDAALMPFVRQFAQVDTVWWAQAPLPGLKQWLAQWLASPLLEAVMVRWPVWRPGDAEPRF
jgi:glutathione S-transferase